VFGIKWSKFQIVNISENGNNFKELAFFQQKKKFGGKKKDKERNRFKKKMEISEKKGI
jgi:hypothetical protein